jgi:hypothetical protein
LTRDIQVLDVNLVHVQYSQEKIFEQEDGGGNKEAAKNVAFI